MGYNGKIANPADIHEILRLRRNRTVNNK